MEDNKKGIWATLGVVGLFIATKLKFVLGILKFAKFSTIISMFVSLGAYALVFGWKFAVAIIYLMFVHEMGHLWAAKKKGIPTSAAIFIPFMGAAIGMKERPKDAKTEAFVAYMGPLFGLLSFLPAIPLYHWTQEPIWGLMIVLGAMINFFNLIPVSPLDGGRIVSVISTKLWLLGLILLAIFVFKTISPVGILVLIVGIITWIDRLQQDKKIKRIEKKREEYQKYIAYVREGLPEGYLDQTDTIILKNRIEYLNTTFKNLVMKETKLTKEELQTYDILAQFVSLSFVEIITNEDETGEETETYYFYPDRLEEFLVPIDHEKEHIKNYYVADKKTKWIAFLLYLALLGVLGYLYLYGNDILTSHPELLQK